MCLRTGPGDLKNTNHLKFDIWQIVCAFLKKMEKITFSENFENRQKHTLKSLYAFFLSVPGRQKPTELNQTILWGLIFHDYSTLPGSL